MIERTQKDKARKGKVNPKRTKDMKRKGESVVNLSFSISLAWFTRDITAASLSVPGGYIPTLETKQRERE